MAEPAGALRLPGVQVAGRIVVVCGAAPESLAVITNLVGAGAVVRVVAPQVPTTVRDHAQRDTLSWVARTWARDDLVDAALVVAATGSPSADAEVLAAAEATGRVAVRAAAPVEAWGTRAGTEGQTGEVVLVGGGPGDLGLLTLAGLEAVRRADVIICDRLAPLAVLAEAPPGAEVIDVAKIPRGAFTSQERINELLVEHGRSGKTVVRLKGGDSFVFGRGGEEWQACAEAGLPVRVVPGVTSAVAAPALAGIPLTHRQLTQGFTVVSGHLPPGDPGSTLDWAALAATNTTLVIMMGVATLGAITEALLAHGLAPETPAATVASAGLPGEQTVRGRLADIAERTAAAGIRPPAITVIGQVAAFPLS